MRKGDPCGCGLLFYRLPRAARSGRADPLASPSARRGYEGHPGNRVRALLALQERQNSLYILASYAVVRQPKAGMVLVVPPTVREERDGPFDQVLREPTLSDKVAKAITEAIVSGRIERGQQLDSERELADQFGVSRTVIREAVRSLAAQGLVETGSGRGVQVSGVDGDAVSRSMGLYLRRNPAIDYARVHEVRSGLEIQIAGLAAERATPDDLSHLAKVNKELGLARPKDERAATLDLELHSAVAAATHNPLFVVMLDSISDVLFEFRRLALSSREMIEYAERAHGMILERLNERDANGAREAMRIHLEESERTWLGLTDSSKTTT